MTRFGINIIPDTAHATCVRSTLYFYNLLHAIELTTKLFTYAGEILVLVLLTADNTCNVLCFSVE